jgi:hypothetical protein
VRQRHVAHPRGGGNNNNASNLNKAGFYEEFIGYIARKKEDVAKMTSP